MQVFFSPEFVAAAHESDTTRKPGWVHESLKGDEGWPLTFLAPTPFTEDDVSIAHSPDYVDAVKSGVPITAALSQGFRTWDPLLWEMVRFSNAGIFAAAMSSLTSGVSASLSCGLHHASFERGRGSCTFNGLAIAAKRLIAKGVDRVLVLDLDAHCGGGTHSLTKDDRAITLLDVAVNPQYDIYKPFGDNRLSIVERADDYLRTVSLHLSKLTASGERFDVCIYNAGVDIHEESFGGLPGVRASTISEREDIVFDWLRSKDIPVAFCLAGGYSRFGLGRTGVTRLHRLTFSAATGRRGDLEAETVMIL